MPPGQLNPAEFVAKWSRVELSELAASQEHFIDLCRMLAQPTPAEHDATGAEYTFEKGVSVTGAGQPLPDGHALTARRAETDQRVLANLLRLNLARAAAQ